MDRGGAREAEGRTWGLLTRPNASGGGSDCSPSATLVPFLVPPPYHVIHGLFFCDIHHTEVQANRAALPSMHPSGTAAGTACTGLHCRDCRRHLLLKQHPQGMAHTLAGRTHQAGQVREGSGLLACPGCRAEAGVRLQGGIHQRCPAEQDEEMRGEAR